MNNKKSDPNNPNPDPAGPYNGAIRRVRNSEPSDSDFQDGDFTLSTDDNENENPLLHNGQLLQQQQQQQQLEEQQQQQDNGNEINDAGLLRSMLQDSEEFYANLEASEAQEEKQCWVCFASEEDDLTAVWVHPCRYLKTLSTVNHDFAQNELLLCRCRGTTKWVHQACIQRWVDEKQKGNNTADVECPQCGTQYIIKFPKANVLVAILDTTDKLVQRLCPVSIFY